MPPGFSREIDLDALEAYLQLKWIPSPLSIYSAARKRPAVHVLVWEEGEVTIECYSRPAPVTRERVRRERFDDLAEELRGACATPSGLT